MKTIANVNEVVQRLSVSLKDEIFVAESHDWESERVDTMKAGHCFVYKLIKFTTSKIVIKIRQPKMFGT